jgi:tripeptidyl-peptidase-1
MQKRTCSQDRAISNSSRKSEATLNTVSVHRTIPFSLPIKVVEHLDFISPTTRFPVEQKVLKTKSVDQNLRMDPTKIRTLYKIGDVTGTGNPANQLHVAGFLKKFYSPTDLTTFYNFYYLAGKAFAKPKVVGPNDDSQPTPEGNLDMQYITSIAANVSSTYWYTDSTVPYPTGINEDFVSWLKALAASTDTLPSVISVSYADEEFVIDPAFQQRCDVEFQKLGVRGASLFFGSGDMGVTGDGGQCHPPNKFVAWWPGSSPYVTSVGAVEEMESQGASFSGGGFSNLYARPAYQDAAVTAYKASEEGKGTPLAFYNHTGAGFPDVSAVGVGFWTYVGGTPDEVGGTSAACPTFAGIVALLNDARMAAGKKALGPLNQLIYQHPEAFTDITDGHNPGHGGCGTDGFACSQGWDPVTGMGTPLYPALLKIAMSLP